MKNLLETLTNPDELTVERQVTAEALLEEQERRVTRERRLAQLRLLWSRRGFLFRALGVGLILATLVAFLIPKQYESTAQLMPPDTGPGNGFALLAALSGKGDEMGSIASDLLGIKSTGALFVGVLRSRTVQDRIVQRFDLKKEYTTRYDDMARLRLQENTSISEDRKSGIITLIVSDSDPKRAAAIATAYIDELDVLMVKLNTSSAHRERVFLEERLGAVKQDLEAAERDFSQFASKNGAVDIPEQGKAILEAAAALQGELIAAQSELQGLKQIYTDENVRVRSTQARINELRSELQKLGGKVGDDSSAESGDGGGDVYPTLRQLPLLGVPYADKYRRLKIEEAVYGNLTKQYEAAKVEEAKEIPSVEVLDPPEVPDRKSFPPRALIITLGTIFALILAALWTLGTARWRAINPQDPAKELAIEVFGVVRSGLPWFRQNGLREKAEESEGESENSGSKDLRDQ